MDDRLGQPADRPTDAVQLGQQMLGEPGPAAPAGRIERFSLPPPRADVGEAVDLQRRRASPCRPAVLGARPLADQAVRPGRVGSLVAKFAILADNDVAGRAALARPRFQQRVLGQFLGDHRLDLEVAEGEQLDRLLQLLGHYQLLRNAKSMRGPSPMDYASR